MLLLVLLVFHGVQIINIAVTQWVPFSLIGEYISYSSSSEPYMRVEEEIDLDDQLELVSEVDNTSLKPGVILGLHNVYLCIPQFIATFISMVIFMIFKEDSYGWAIRIGGFFSIFGGFMALKTKQISHLK